MLIREHRYRIHLFDQPIRDKGHGHMLNHVLNPSVSYMKG